VERLGLFTVWAIAGTATLALGALGRELIRQPVVTHLQPIVDDRARPGDPNPWARWAVTETLSAHYVLISHVETQYLEEASSIARQLTDPIKTRYSEVLIYFHRPGRPDDLPPRRVQWTPAHGYVETIYTP
jgi:hypothetical protein